MSTNDLASIEEAVAALQEGRPVIVADDEDRENEGDVILSAELASQEWLAWTVRYTSGYLCAPMPSEWADRLELPPMVTHNEDARRHRLHGERRRRIRRDDGHQCTRSRTNAERAGRPERRPTSSRPATSCRCAPSQAACASARGTPRPRST